MTVELFCHVTGDNKCSKCSPPASKHPWTRLVMDCRALSEPPRAFTNRLTDIKNSLVGACLKLELNTLGLTVLQVETKGLGSKGVWALPRKLSVYRRVLILTFFLVLVRGTHS